MASRYWESYVERPRDFDTLISAIRKLRSQERYSFPVDNLCIYPPDTLSKEEIFRCEMLVFILKTLERHFFEFFHVMLKCLDESMIDLLEEIINERSFPKNRATFSIRLITPGCSNISGRKSLPGESLFDRMNFIEDLMGLNLKKAGLRPGHRTVRSSYQTDRPQLNPNSCRFMITTISTYGTS